MNKHHPHNDIIEKKLEQLPVGNADALWNDMHSILDKKMPQKKERRRFIAWFLISKPFLLLTVGFIIGTGSSLLFLSTKKNSNATITKLPDSPQPYKFNEDDKTKGSQTEKENITIASEPKQKDSSIVSATTPSTGTNDYVINNSRVAPKTKKQSKKYIETDQVDQFLYPVSASRPDFYIVPVSMKSNHSDLLLATNLIADKIPFNLQIEDKTTPVTKESPNKNKKGFYAGITSGIDLSSIHFRSPRTGATKGFIIGYAFNEKWSIESGLFWDTKKVYDNGKYFNPPGYTPTSGMTIVAVNGRSRLYELPVNLKYTIKPGKHDLFATAGLSSYFMRSESYDYEYWQNNQPGGHNYLSYKNETNNWFSVVNFGLGYSHKLSAIGTLRVEPYLRLPIKELGVGKMPIMSTGLNFGFTRTLK